MFEPMELTNDAVIKVIGVGGGGGNAVEHMVRERIEGVEFFAVNTDAQALRKTAVGQTIQIGGGITKGLGAGANPEVGRNLLKKIVRPCALHWKVRTWSLSQRVWVAVRVPAQHLLWLK
jgi:cell division GTPase FtsZ